MIGGFGTLARWHPAVASCEETSKDGVTTRVLKLHGGGKIVERLESKNDAGRGDSYSILESPLPVARYRATLHAEDQPGARSCRVDWSGEFEPSGAPESEAVKVVRGIYDSGLQSLSKMFGG